jgi:spore maturation protein CgeB
MRILILSADYPRFLRDLYLSRPGLAESSYATQMAARNASLFGVADFYSRNFRAHGHEAAEIHINNPWLQYAWAREFGLSIPPLEPGPRPDTAPAPPSKKERVAAVAKSLLRPLKPLMGPVARPALRRLRALSQSRSGARAYAPDRTDWEHAILRAQIDDFRPDLILNQELAYLRSAFFEGVKRPGQLLFGQIASSMPESDSFGGYDLMISSLPNQVGWFRGRGLKAELNRLAFEPAVLERLGLARTRDIELSFVGSLSPDHVQRIAFLEYVATRTPLKVWGNGIERLRPSSPLHARYQGEAWGRGMYQILRRSLITLNFHIDLAEDWANNMRLYEATGMGTLLLTDQKRNLEEMFVPGEHLAAYADPEDCVRQVRALLADDDMREKIAAAGQRHAITTQNYFLRTGEILALVQALRTH